ncbi:Nudix family hydrolase [Dyella caseinilytica]|uniref:8-oxo-dGTP diphosphatase n=2 Tax=Dyella caseinilytica TaxID=1849581 RepID=A0ABX7H1J4_9GAMM|nr:Nudix family hydrolase [Dyella caseinilytica]QRN55752.1 Nudix family hydrolase [Dyella caseinilytica]
MHVMAGVLRDAQGRVLLAQRPEGKHLAGMWEFPGGKLEPGEQPQHALVRELREELGIQADLAQSVPLIRVPWRYGERGLLLDAWQFTQWQGTPVSLEGQALQWVLPSAVDPTILAPADRPILQALRLPSMYAITPADITTHHAEFLCHRISTALERGVRLIQLRLPQWPLDDVQTLAMYLQRLALPYGAQLLLNGDIEGALKLGDGVGVHLKSSQLAALDRRPLPWTQLVGCSCHDASELEQAARVGADFATLSPVAPTASHPDATPLGWPRFQSLAEAAALPVYALGGVTPAQEEQARRHAGQGVAGIGAFWSGTP